MMNETGIKPGQTLRLLENDIGGIFGVGGAPIIFEIERAVDRTMQRMNLIHQLAQFLGPVGLELLIQQVLGAPQIGHPQKGVLLLLIRETRLIQLFGQPMSAVEANIDLEGKPGLQTQVHEAELGMLEIEIKMAALARLNLYFKVFGLGVSDDLKGHARFDAIENGNEPLSDLIPAGDFSGQILLAGLAGRDEEKGPSGFLRQGPGFVFDGFGGALDQLAEIFDQNVAGVQIRLHHLWAIQLAQSAAQSQPIKTGKNS